MDKNLGVYYAQSFFSKENSYSYDKLVKLATLGQDGVWKNKIIKNIPQGIGVLELANGTGILSSLLLKNDNIVYGIDLTFEYLKKLQKKKINVISVNGTAEFLPFQNNYFDCVVSSYLPKYTDLPNLVKECYRVLKEGGLLILHDFAFPKKIIYRFLWYNYFKVLRYFGKIDPNWKNVFNGLDKLIIENNWDVELVPVLSLNGFIRITRSYQTFETSAIISAIKNEERQ